MIKVHGVLMFGLRDEILNKIKNISQKYDYNFYVFGSRNSLSHMYDKEISKKVYNNVKNEYIILLKDLQEKI